MAEDHPPTDPVEALKALAAAPGGVAASGAVLDEEAKTLTVPANASGPLGNASDVTLAAASDTVSVTVADGKELSYPLGSFFLALLRPDESYMKYRGACRKLGVDPIKVTERAAVASYFGGDAAAAAAPAAEDKAAEPVLGTSEGDTAASDRKERKKEKGGDKSRGKEKKEKAKESREERHARKKEEARKVKEEKDIEAKAKAKKKEMAKKPVSTEELMSRLDTVVGKRDAPEDGAGPAPEGGATAGAVDPFLLSADANKDREEETAIFDALSSKGFEVHDLVDEIEADRPAVERITSMEIPVGDSASVLRCGAGADVGRDFSRVLDLYTEVVTAEDRAKRGKRGGSGSEKKRKPSSSSSGQDSSKRSRSSATSSGKQKPAGKPIIVIPNAMTSVITLVNAFDFFGNSLFVPRDEAIKKTGANNLSQLRKRGASIAVTHRVAQRLGGREIEYEIVDNPASRLRSAADWDRVVAVVAQGAEWQFKGWRYPKPVDLFGKAFGFYIGIEGAPIPQVLLGWNVKLGKLNRDKRGLDSVTYAQFWNGLDEWMSVHKQEYLQSSTED